MVPWWAFEDLSAAERAVKTAPTLHSFLGASVPFRYYFGATSVPLWSHFGATLVLLWYHWVSVWPTSPWLSGWRTSGTCRRREGGVLGERLGMVEGVGGLLCRWELRERGGAGRVCLFCRFGWFFFFGWGSWLVWGFSFGVTLKVGCWFGRSLCDCPTGCLGSSFEIGSCNLLGVWDSLGWWWEAVHFFRWFVLRWFSRLRIRLRFCKSSSSFAWVSVFVRSLDHQLFRRSLGLLLFPLSFGGVRVSLAFSRGLRIAALHQPFGFPCRARLMSWSGTGDRNSKVELSAGGLQERCWSTAPRFYWGLDSRLQFLAPWALQKVSSSRVYT